VRVVQIHTTYLEPGGEDLVVQRERELLMKHGHTVEPITFRNPEKPVEQVRNLALANWNRASGRRVSEALEAAPVDVVHVHNTWFTGSPSSVAAAHRHAPVVATLHNYRRNCLNAYLYRDDAPCTDCVGRLPWKGVLRRCYRDSAPASVAIGIATGVNRQFRLVDRSVDLFLVLSDFAADLAEQSGVDRSQIVRHDNFVPDVGPRLQPPSDSETVLAIGRLSPEKGFVELVESWNRRGPDGLRLMVVGDGPERGRVEESAGPSVDVVGRKTPDEVAELMRSCRALLFPSRWFEGQPLVILEALAAGLPVLSSDHPPLKEIIDGAGQLVVENGEWDEALSTTADNAWLELASSAARARYEERYSSDVALGRLESIYRSVLR
jgi:glycosyltransferase involved in cell wall biosynthesis